MNPIYNFYVNDRQCFPIYKDDLSKDYEQETNQQFYRPKLNGKLTFVRDDYDFINSQSFETEFIFSIEKSDDMGLTWNNYFSGKFMKTDCEFDDDGKSLVVQPDVKDQYNDVLAGLEKEYDIIRLAPHIEPLVMKRRPLIQIYIPGDTVVSCFLGGTYWEQDANPVTDFQALEETYHFSLCNLLKEINLTVTGSDAAASGLYTGRMSIVNDGGVEKMEGTLRRQGDNTYYLTVEQQRGTSWFNWAVVEVRLFRQDGTVIWYWGIIGDGNYDERDFDMVAENGATGTSHGEMNTYRIYGRYLLDLDTIQGLTTYPVPTDDIVENNRNYRRVIGYSFDIAFISVNYSEEPTEWGRSDNGMYFLPPYSITNDTFFPIARSTWRYASIWFGYYIMDWLVEESGRATYVLRDTYPVGSIINKLLQQFAPDITHEQTPEYSQFLYGETNPISGQAFRLFVSQKSNLLVGDYDKPAQKAPGTLQQFTNMLRDCFRCYWYIEDNKFKIEHIEFFRNGGTYSNIVDIGFDLTTLENIRNAKTWGYVSSKWSYEKVDLAERYQFAWMDDVTQAFEGEPMEVVSKYVTAGKIEDINVSNFTTDVDFMMLNPGNISQDGFALFAAITANALNDPDGLFDGSEGTDGNTSPTYALRPELIGQAAIARFYGNSDANGATGQIVFYNSGNVISTQGNFTLVQSQQTFNIPVNIPSNADAVGFVVAGYGFFVFYDLDVTGAYELPFVTRTVGNTNYIMQNGYMSFSTLVPTYYPYDLPASQVKINGQNFTAFGIDRKKKQEVNFPTIDDPDVMKLIKTYIGNGQIDKISINLHSRMNKITLKYDTE